MLANLARYITAERYPTNDLIAETTPIFRDAYGATCAVGALLVADGHEQLVRQIAHTNNFVRVAELHANEELAAWLTDNGLTLAEAARIQPSYSNETETHWQPTASVFAGILGGGTTHGAGSAELAFTPGLRVGVRMVTESADACDECVYQTFALFAEYTRGFIVDRGSSNLISLLAQIEFGNYTRTAATYLLVGPQVSLDEDALPGFAIGGQLGYGVHFRDHSFQPFFAELVLNVLGNEASATVRGGLNVGASW